MSQYIHAFDSANKRVKPVNVDANGNLQVDIVSSAAGGDATAANQVTNHSKLDTLATNQTSTNTKLDSAITKLGEIDTVLDSIANSGGGTATLEGIRQAILSDLQGKLDHLSDDVDGLEGLQTATNTKLDHLSDDIDGVDTLITSTNTKLDTIDTSINTIEACVSSNQLAVSHAALTELAGAINTSKVDVNVASDISHYQDGDAIAASSKGQLVMGRDNSNNAHPLHITANGDLEVEIADFVKGQATKENSFPVTLATNQPSIAVTNSAVEPTLSQTTLESATAIADGSSTSEIDMNGFNHLTIFGSSSVNFGSFVLARRATSGGSNFLDGSNMISASDPTGGSNYHFSATFENIGTRYVAFQNVAGSSQTVTLYAVKHR